MNRGQNQVFYGCLQITTVLLRFPTTSVRCFYEFMPDCAGYDHGRSLFITAVLRSVTVLLWFDTVLLRFLTVVRTVMNRGQNQVFYGCRQITTVLLRFPTTSVWCFYEFMSDCAGYDHGRSRFITAVLRLVTMPLRFDTDGVGTCTVIDGRATVDYGLLRRDDDHVTV